MNVPTFTGFNKAVFLYLCTKSLTAGRGTALGVMEGGLHICRTLAKPFHLYKNTFLQLTSRFSYCAKDFPHHCNARNQWRHVMQDQCPRPQVLLETRGLHLMAPLDVPPGCIKPNYYTNLSVPEEILDSVIMRANPLLRERWYQNGQSVEESVVFMLGFSVQITLFDMWQFENVQNTPHSTDRSTLDEQRPLNLPKD